MTILAFALIAFLSTGTITTKEKIQHNWKLLGIEKSGSIRDVEEKNKKDYVNLMADGKYDMTLYGGRKAGSYSFNETGKTINFKNESAKFFFKLIAVSDTALVIEYQHPDLVRSKLHYKKIIK